MVRRFMVVWLFDIGEQEPDLRGHWFYRSQCILILYGSCWPHAWNVIQKNCCKGEGAMALAITIQLQFYGLTMGIFLSQSV